MLILFQRCTFLRWHNFEFCINCVTLHLKFVPVSSVSCGIVVKKIFYEEAVFFLLLFLKKYMLFLLFLIMLLFSLLLLNFTLYIYRVYKEKKQDMCISCFEILYMYSVLRTKWHKVAWLQIMITRLFKTTRLWSKTFRL